MFDGRLKSLVLLLFAVLALGASGYAATGGVSIPGASHGFTKASDRGTNAGSGNAEAKGSKGDDDGTGSGVEDGTGDDNNDNDGDDGGRPTVIPPPGGGHCGKSDRKPPCKRPKDS